MGKKLPTTPRSRVRSAIRRVFLRSRERAAAIKANKHCCAHCGIKASVAKGREVKLEVHHTAGIGNWEKVIDAIFEEILCKPELMLPLCKACHLKIHAEEHK